MLQSARWAVSLALVLCPCFISSAHGQWSDLAAKAPSASNAILLMDVDKVLASPIAQREGWKSRFDKAFASGLITTPPHTKRLMIAVQLDYETWQPANELAVLDFSRDVSMTNIARQTKGAPDTVANLSALVLPQDTYIVELAKQRLAGMAPANRQAVVRWLRETLNRSKPELSPYLTAAVNAAEKIDIVQAFDMTDAVPADVIRAKLKMSSVVSKAKPKVDVEKLTSLLATLQGVMFEVTFKDAPHARFLVDFDQDAAPLAAIGKPLLLEILNDKGARIADFDDWTPRVDGKRFSLTGKLSPEGRRKVFSLIDAPVAGFAATASDADNSAGNKNQTGYATQAYFRSIQSILDDLQKEVKDSVTLGQNAAWIDRWARKIERLPMLDVDKDMLEYSSFVSGSLRSSSDSIKGIGINSAARTAQVFNSGQGWVSGSYGSDYSGRYGSFDGYYEYRNVDGQRRAIRAEEKAKGATSARGIFRQIESGTAAIRRTMVERYKLEF